MSTSRAPAGAAARGHKTRRLADELRLAIAELRWPGGKLPTETQLAQEQGVSLNTVRRAVDLLVQDGLVYRRQGSGTYVSATRLPGSGPTIGVVVPSMTYYYPRIIASVERELASRGSQMLVRSTEWDPAVERDAVTGLIRSGSAGLILVPCLGDEDEGRRPGHPQAPAHPQAPDHLPAPGDPRGPGVPVVLVERGMELPVTLHEFACSHHAAGARAAIEHLLHLGHRRIGYLERSSPHTAPQIRTGLAVALEGAGLGPDPVLAASLPRWTAQDADRFLEQLVARGATAALCFADREASLLVSAAHRAGLRVPDDLSVIGYDDELADLSEVPLTAVSPAKAEIGRRAVDILASRLADPDGPRRQEALVPRLVVRDSTGPAPERS